MLERLARPILARGTCATGDAAAKMGSTAKMVASEKCIAKTEATERLVYRGVKDLSGEETLQK